MKLDKAQKAPHTAACDKIREAYSVMDTAVDKYNEVVDAAVAAFNEAMGAAHADLENAATEYNAKIEEGREGLIDVGSDLRGEFDEKSEKWQEGDKGQAADEWIQKFESPEDAAPDFECPEAQVLDVASYHIDGPDDPLDNLPGESDGE